MSGEQVGQSTASVPSHPLQYIIALCIPPLTIAGLGP